MSGAIDPTATPFALLGRVVTMDDSRHVLAHGAVYIRGGEIVAVADAAAPPPVGFEVATRIITRGTIYPGLIELHNHLSYNILRLWAVPKQFTNRDRWSVGPTYRRLISGPMQVVGRTAGLPEAVARYVEAKCILSGTTTSQGIALYSNQGIGTYYYGLVRNVERTHDPAMPDAKTHIADVDATSASGFLSELNSAACLLLHLAEGTDSAACDHFKALQMDATHWALAASLAAIHSVPLERADFDVLARYGCSMVWSPLSNLLLYGKTADVAAARAAGVKIGIGSDWSPSGSKNVLFELKVARVMAQGALGDSDLLAAATRDAAAMLGWQQSIGSIEAGKRADLLVVAGQAGDPYGHLFDSRESDIVAVLVDGVPRVGRPSIMARFALGPTESVAVGARQRLLNLAQPGVNDVVAHLSLGVAQDRLRGALNELPTLARNLETPRPAFAAATESAAPSWQLVLDHDEPQGVALRPHLPDRRGHLTAITPRVVVAAAAIPLSQLLTPMSLDPLTVADDGDFIDALVNEPNLPQALKDALPACG